VGGRSGSLTSPTLTLAQVCDLIQESASEELVRVAGELVASADTGVLLVGVHLLPRDPLHTSRRRG
jgi:hypothetical protein